jgi:adenylate kinase family enzyme
MAKVIWLTGKTCVGKSTWGKRQRQHVGVEFISTGQLCREKFGEEAMALDDKPVTPEATEPFVRDVIMKAIRDLHSSDTLVVDSAPRSKAQVNWIEEILLNSTDEHVVYYCSCKDEEREFRIETRCKESALDRQLIERRLEVEDAVFLGVLENLLASKLDVKLLDTTTYELRDTRPPDRELDIEHMFKLHAELNDEATRKFDITTSMMHHAAQVDSVDPMAPGSLWLRRFLVMAKKEIDEALAEMPEKWWTVDKVNLPSVRTEIIDAWHFLMSGALAAGLSGREFARLYYQKRAINLARWRSGQYSSKKTGPKDDAHLGRKV